MVGSPVRAKINRAMQAAGSVRTVFLIIEDKFMRWDSQLVISLSIVRTDTNTIRHFSLQVGYCIAKTDMVRSYPIIGARKVRPASCRSDFSMCPGKSIGVELYSRVMLYTDAALFALKAALRCYRNP